MGAQTPVRELFWSVLQTPPTGHAAFMLSSFFCPKCNLAHPRPSSGSPLRVSTTFSWRGRASNED